MVAGIERIPASQADRTICRKEGGAANRSHSLSWARWVCGRLMRRQASGVPQNVSPLKPPEETARKAFPLWMRYDVGRSSWVMASRLVSATRFHTL